MITLDHATHTYHNSAKPTVKYTSVTTVLGQYKEKFDEDFHAERIAKRKGVDKEEIERSHNCEFMQTGFKEAMYSRVAYLNDDQGRGGTLLTD